MTELLKAAVITAALLADELPPPVIIGETTAPDAGIRLTSANGAVTDLPQGFQHFGERQS